MPIEGWFHHIDAQMAACFVVLVVAAARGASPERMLAAVLLAARVIEELHDNRWHPHAITGSMDMAHLLIDVAMLIAIVPIAIQANRVYPLWLGGAQIVVLASHLVRATLSKAAPVASPIMEELAFNIQVAIMAVGLGFHILRRHRLGRDYPSWRPAKTG